jgi:hypothetical protein
MSDAVAITSSLPHTNKNDLNFEDPLSSPLLVFKIAVVPPTNAVDEGEGGPGFLTLWCR